MTDVRQIAWLVLEVLSCQNEKEWTPICQPCLTLVVDALNFTVIQSCRVVICRISYDDHIDVYSDIDTDIDIDSRALE